MLYIFLISFVLTFLVRKIAIKKSIIDEPNERSSHTVATPRGGGLAIVIAWFIGLLFVYFNNEIEKDLFYALMSGLILVIVGFLDDIYDLNPKIRIIAQLISAILALFFLGGLNLVDLGFFKIQSTFILTPLALLGIIWFINLYNFLDGIDGYAASEAIFISIMFSILTNQNYYLILALAVLSFLFWNWQPAKIFMGDVGSTLLGFNFAVFAIYEQNVQVVSIVIFLAISSLFWFDATLTLFRRFLRKEKLSIAHKKHAYQRLTQAGYSHQKVVIYSIILNIIIGIGVYFTHFYYSKLSLILLILVITILFFIVKLIDREKPF